MKAPKGHELIAGGQRSAAPGTIAERSSRPEGASLSLIHAGRNPVGVGANYLPFPKVGEYANLGLTFTTPLGLIAPSGLCRQDACAPRCQTSVCDR